MISAVRRTTRRAVRHASPTEPLPATRSELLGLTVSRPGISVAEAARELRLAPNTVSTIVGALAAQGLITRGRSRADGRTVRLNPTNKARQRLTRWRDLRAELAANALAGLPAGDREALRGGYPGPDAAGRADGRPRGREGSSRVTVLAPGDAAGGGASAGSAGGSPSGQNI